MVDADTGEETITVIRLKMHDLFDNYPHYIAYP